MLNHKIFLHDPDILLLASTGRKHFSSSCSYLVQAPITPYDQCFQCWIRSQYILEMLVFEQRKGFHFKITFCLIPIKAISFFCGVILKKSKIAHLYFSSKVLDICLCRWAENDIVCTERESVVRAMSVSFGFSPRTLSFACRCFVCFILEIVLTFCRNTSHVTH